MILSFHPCFDADIHIVPGSRSLDTGDIDIIRQADAIILPQTCPRELFMACAGSAARVFPDYHARFEYPGKTGQKILFEKLGLPCPKTLCWSDVNHFKNAYPDIKDLPHELPFFVKDDKSHEAEGVFLVKDSATLRAALEYLCRREGSGLPGFVTQACIPSEGDVLRGVIIGKKIVTYWKRPAQPGQMVTTIRKGALIDHHWQPALQEKATAEIRALAGKTGINLAAIDLVFPLTDQEPEPLFLEINYYFGRKGLGGSEKYYQLLCRAIKNWLEEAGLNGGTFRLL